MKKRTVQQELTISYFVLVIVLWIFTSIFVIRSRLQEFNETLEEKISWTAYLLSRDGQLVKEMEEGCISETTAKKLHEMEDGSKEIDYIVLADTDSIRLYHKETDQIGQKFAGGDEGPILNGALPYVTTGQGRYDYQKRAFHGIQTEEGKILGFVLVSASMDTVYKRQWEVVRNSILIFGGLLLVGMGLAFFMARKIRKRLLGHEPDAFVHMFLQREEILDNLDEGILALHLSKSTYYRNPAAIALLGEDFRPEKNEDMVGIVRECVEQRKAKIGIPFSYGENSLLLNALPLLEGEDMVGVLLILRDRTEITQMAEQLTGTTHIVEALRATTHEYLNKLHIISGMLQIGECEEAISFIDGVSHETRNGYQTIIRQIQNKTIAALLLGKQSHAKELNVQFTLQKDSYLEAHNAFLSTQELVTIIGNLVENAFHAVEEKSDLRQVQLFIQQREEGIMLVIDDTGCGMTKEQIDKIYEGHFTTRGEGHGIGLRLVQEIVKKRAAYLGIDSEPGVGSTFTVSFQKKGHRHDKDSDC